MIDLACDMKDGDYFHSDDPVEAAKFVVSDAVAALWEAVLRHDGFAAFIRRVPEQLICWESEYGWTRRGYGQVPEGWPLPGTMQRLDFARDNPEITPITEAV